MFSTLLQQWQVLIAVSFVLLFYFWESIVPFFKNRQHRIRHGLRNLIVAALNAIILLLLFSSATVAVATFAEIKDIGVLNWLDLPSIPGAIIALALMDFWTYLWHRLNHTVPFLWRFHRMHHSDPEMDVTTATRFHVGEISLSSCLRLMVIPLIGMPIWILVLYDVLLLANTQFHHANISLKRSLDRHIRLIIVSPNMHKIHHSRLRQETDSNYSSLFSIWDRLFGTFRRRRDYLEIQFGVDGFDTDEDQSIKGMLATPLRKR